MIIYCTSLSLYIYICHTDLNQIGASFTTCTEISGFCLMGTCKPLPGMSFYRRLDTKFINPLQMPDINQPFWSLVVGSYQWSLLCFEQWMRKQPGATNLLDRGPFSLGHQVLCCLPRVGQVVGFEHGRCLVSKQVSPYWSWHCIHHCQRRTSPCWSNLQCLLGLLHSLSLPLSLPLCSWLNIQCTNMKRS